jgi:prepilin-type N-terminal cleavage/methylation domain-containing protein
VSRRGFTLLETLVALAITGVVLGALAGSVRRAALARTRATAEADRIGAARTLLLRLAAELEAARPPDGSRFEPFAVDVPVHDRPWARLRLTTGVFAALRTVAYAVEPDRQRPDAGVLVRADAPAGAGDVAGLPVLDGVRAFRVRCFDGLLWQPACAGRLPRAVEVTIAVDDGRRGVEELGVTVTPATAG